jgi:hypothetical protein
MLGRKLSVLKSEREISDKRFCVHRACCACYFNITALPFPDHLVHILVFVTQHLFRDMFFNYTYVADILGRVAEWNVSGHDKEATPLVNRGM